MTLSFMFLIYSIIPESPRWLLSKGKLEEATRIITKLAEVNGKQLPDRIISSFESDIGKTKGRVWQLFSTRVLAFRTIVIIINWYAASSLSYNFWHLQLVHTHGGWKESSKSATPIICNCFKYKLEQANLLFQAPAHLQGFLSYHNSNSELNVSCIKTQMETTSWKT